MKSKFTATRRIQFCCGHRVMNHENKCANIHGHNYVAFLFAEADGLDSIGRVIDFSVLKNLIGKWIDDNWDHTFLAFEEDIELISSIKPFNNKPVFVCEFNPTAENMAEYLLKVVAPDLLKGTGARLYKVELWETENCIAEVTLND